MELLISESVNLRTIGLSRRVQLIHLNKLVEKSFLEYYNFIIDNNIENNLTKKDCKRIFLNYLILEICNDIKQYSLQDRCLLFYQEVEYESQISLLVKRLLKSIPLNYVINANDIDSFTSKLREGDPEVISDYCNSMNKAKNSLTKFKQFIKRNDLIYLHESYFRAMTNKMIVIR